MSLKSRLRKTNTFLRPNYLNWFTRLDTRKMKHKYLAVFDIETSDLLGKVGGIAFTSEADYPILVKFNDHHTISNINFLRHLLTKKYNGFITYAHNLARFDASHLFSDMRVQRWLRSHKFEVHMEKAFVVIRKHKHSWYLADSWRIIQLPLAQVMKSFTPHRTKAKLPTTPFDWHDKAWMKRIEDDTLGLFESLLKIRSIVRQHFGVPLSMTTPSTALRAARAMLPLKKVQRPATTALAWLRTAYSGGRIEVFWQGRFKGKIVVFDINSAYAWALRGEFPIGRGQFRTTEPEDGYYIGRCHVSVPTDQHIPPVLSRMFVHAFAVGEFQAMLTKEEVEFARTNGATVVFLEGFYWKHTHAIFADFIDKCAKVRKKDYAGPLGQTVKLMQNGLYGILGLRMDRTRLLIAEHSPGKEWSLGFNRQTGRDIEGVFERVFVRDTPNAMPHWAAIVTARVRCRLTEFLILFQRLGLAPLYAHTDSIWAGVNGEIPEQIKRLITPEYGNLKIEAEGDETYIFNPGEAALRTNKIKNGKRIWKTATKGWKATPIHFRSDKVEKIKQTQMFHMMTAARQGRPGRVIEKRIKDYRSMRRRIPPESIPGSTEPLIALAYNYTDYWSYRNWYVDKLRRQPPRARDYLTNPADVAILNMRWRHAPATFVRGGKRHGKAKARRT